MKNIQLLSVVFSLIMFTGVTAGTAIVFAESDDDDHDYDIKAKLDGFCEMSPEELAALVEEHGKGEDHLADIEEYCTLDDSGRDAFIEEHKDEFTKAHDYDIKAKLDGFCEMSEEDKEALQEKYPMISDYQEKIDEYCSLDESEKDAYIEEHKDDIKNKMSDHKDSMKGEMSDHKDSMKGEMSDHKDSMKGEMSDHKDSMKGEMSDHKSHVILRASTLTDEQKDEIKAVHEELRDFKHSLRDNSMSDSEKQEIRDQFMEKAKEFSMTWLSPRHQVAAGIDANLVECREGFALVMKTSNASPICVKETTAEKLIERGIVISSI